MGSGKRANLQDVGPTVNYFARLSMIKLFGTKYSVQND